MQDILEQFRATICTATAQQGALRIRGGGSKDWYGQALDGALLDTHGTKVEFSILASASSTQRKQMAVLIQHDLKALGITVQVVPFEFRAMLESLSDLPIVGDVRGAGYFQAIELVKDKQTKETFDDEESERLLRGFLSGALYHHGLICRADDRGDPVVQLAPPLIADSEQFAEIEQVLRTVLGAASELL